MTDTFVADYSFARPAPSALHAQGFRGVVRYLSNTPAKNLSSSEAKALHKAGIAIALVWETTASRATEGEAAGRSDRVDAERQAKALGYPRHCPIFIAVDQDVAPEAVLPYFSGWFAANKYPAGPYGSARVVDGVVEHHPKAYVWQTAAWSYGRLSHHADLYQRTGGTSYDTNVVCKRVPFWGPVGVVFLLPGGAEAEARRKKKRTKSRLARRTDAAVRYALHHLRHRDLPVIAEGGERHRLRELGKEIDRVLSIKEKTK